MKGSGTPIWDDLVTSDDLAALDPGVPDPWPRSANVVVIGAGAIGLSIAMACTAAGSEVVVCERDRCASQASGRAAGGLAPDAHPELGPRWHALARRSLDLHRARDAELGYGLRPMDLRVLPDLVVPNQGHVNPLRMCAAFARHAGTIATGVTVTDVTDDGIVTDHGSIAAEHVVYATGEAPPPAAIGGQSFIRGHVLATAPAPFELGGIVASLRDDMLFVQTDRGHIVAGSTKEPGEDAIDVRDDKIDAISRALSKLFPAASDLEITHRWTCFRPNIAGDLPVVKRISDCVIFAAGLYSTGILMAPVVGEIVAGAIASGADPELDL